MKINNISISNDVPLESNHKYTDTDFLLNINDHDDYYYCHNNNDNDDSANDDDDYFNYDGTESLLKEKRNTGNINNSTLSKNNPKLSLSSSSSTVLSTSYQSIKSNLSFSANSTNSNNKSESIKNQTTCSDVAINNGSKKSEKHNTYIHFFLHV